MGSSRGTANGVEQGVFSVDLGGRTPKKKVLWLSHEAVDRQKIAGAVPTLQAGISHLKAGDAEATWTAFGLTSDDPILYGPSPTRLLI